MTRDASIIPCHHFGLSYARDSLIVKQTRSAAARPRKGIKHPMRVPDPRRMSLFQNIQIHCRMYAAVVLALSSPPMYRTSFLVLRNVQVYGSNVDVTQRRPRGLAQILLPSKPTLFTHAFSCLPTDSLVKTYQSSRIKKPAKTLVS